MKKEDLMDVNQMRLMELVVGNVLKKHKVELKSNHLSLDEKRKIKEIVTNIEREVKQFLEKQPKKVTEQDVVSTTHVNEDDPSIPTSTLEKKKVYRAPNNVNHVKNFINQNKK